jgi:hypothetical protein
MKRAQKPYRGDLKPLYLKPTPRLPGAVYAEDMSPLVGGGRLHQRRYRLNTDGEPVLLH